MSYIIPKTQIEWGAAIEMSAKRVGETLDVVFAQYTEDFILGNDGNWALDVCGQNGRIIRIFCRHGVSFQERILLFKKFNSNLSQFEIGLASAINELNGNVNKAG